MTRTRVEPDPLRDSDLYFDAPDEATRLWKEGYRPMPASALDESLRLRRQP